MAISPKEAQRIMADFEKIHKDDAEKLLTQLMIEMEQIRGSWFCAKCNRNIKLAANNRWVHADNHEACYHWMDKNVRPLPVPSLYVIEEFPYG